MSEEYDPVGGELEAGMNVAPRHYGINVELPEIRVRMPEYKYNEELLLEEIKLYIAGTYSEHYGGKIQTTEYIMSQFQTSEALIFNVLKYAARYGKKDNKYDRKDLLKAIHYLILTLYFHDSRELS